MSGAIEHKESTIESSDHLHLFTQSWKTPFSKAVLIVVHGLKDHSSRYNSFAETLAANGYAVHSLDLRGHGKSEGERAFVKSFDDYLDDLGLFFDQVRREESDKPFFLFGHSMGGAIALLYSLTRNPNIKGLVLSAAATKLRPGDSFFIVNVTKLLGGITPKRQVFKLDNNLFTRDEDFLAAMNSDPLIYNEPHPARTAAELIRAIERVQKTMTSLTVPVVLLHGTADKITNPEGTRQLEERASSKDKTLKLYEGHYHDLLHDLGNTTVSDDILHWLDSHSDITHSDT